MELQALLRGLGGLWPRWPFMAFEASAASVDFVSFVASVLWPLMSCVACVACGLSWGAASPTVSLHSGKVGDVKTTAHELGPDADSPPFRKVRRLAKMVGDRATHPPHRCTKDRSPRGTVQLQRVAGITVSASLT